MRLEIGNRVRCTDGAYGELADIVIDPLEKRVTHLVVQPEQHDGQRRLVPIQLAKGQRRRTARDRTGVHPGRGAGVRVRARGRLPPAR